jgi:hypothetical protein
MAAATYSKPGVARSRKPRPEHESELPGFLQDRDVFEKKAADQDPAGKVRLGR